MESSRVQLALNVSDIETATRMYEAAKEKDPRGSIRLGVGRMGAGEQAVPEQFLPAHRLGVTVDKYYLMLCGR